MLSILLAVLLIGCHRLTKKMLFINRLAVLLKEKYDYKDYKKNSRNVSDPFNIGM